jgi:ATP-dependent 26S proteasome regulatory subunit
MNVATRLCLLVERSGSALASKTDLQKAMALVESNLIGSTRIKTSFSISNTLSKSSCSNDLFKSVGGNNKAKLALEDALALDPKKRQLLSVFGLNAPTGVMLYGPPGNGKTLLARAIAQAVGAGNNVGGAFISLKASDIVRPEIGNSEKLIVSAFESARVNAPSVIFIDEFQVSQSSVC